MKDTDPKSLIPVHVILGVSDYSKIKTATSQRTGATVKTVAEFNLFGWSTISPGTEQNIDSMFLAHTTSTTYEELKNKPNGDQNVVHEEFMERLSRGVKGRY